MRLFARKHAPKAPLLWEDAGDAGLIPLEDMLMRVPHWEGPLKIMPDGSFPRGGACVWCVVGGSGTTKAPSVDQMMAVYDRVADLGKTDRTIRAIIAPVFAPACQAAVSLVAAQLHRPGRLVLANRWTEDGTHESFIGGNPAQWPGSQRVADAIGAIDGPAHGMAMVLVQLHRVEGQ